MRACHCKWEVSCHNGVLTVLSSLKLQPEDDEEGHLGWDSHAWTAEKQAARTLSAASTARCLIAGATASTRIASATPCSPLHGLLCGGATCSVTACKSSRCFCLDHRRWQGSRAALQCEAFRRQNEPPHQRVSCAMPLLTKVQVHCKGCRKASQSVQCFARQNAMRSY